MAFFFQLNPKLFIFYFILFFYEFAFAFNTEGN